MLRSTGKDTVDGGVFVIIAYYSAGYVDHGSNASPTGKHCDVSELRGGGGEGRGD